VGSKTNKILTKDNLARKGWVGNQHCIFCQCTETVEQLFIHRANSLRIWTWIVRYNNFHFNCCTIDELWQLNVFIPFKDDNICEMVRRAVTWVIWKERNRLIFKEGSCKSLRSIGGDLITLLKYWGQIKGNRCLDNLHLIVPTYVNDLSLQIIEEQLGIRHTEVEDHMFGIRN
jgi:hypothetical protein